LNSEDIIVNNKEKLTMDYHSNMHKIEQEISDVKAKKEDFRRSTRETL